MATETEERVQMRTALVLAEVVVAKLEERGHRGASALDLLPECKALRTMLNDLGLSQVRGAQAEAKMQERVKSAAVRRQLGDVLGSLNYMGACANCGGQFMSRSEFVWTNGGPGRYCDIRPSCVAAAQAVRS